MTQGQYVAAAYGVVLAVVVAYVAILSAKLARLQGQTVELLDLVRRRLPVETAAVTPRETVGETPRGGGHAPDTAVSSPGPPL